MDTLEAVYLSRRLAETRRVQDLAASIRFDLARSGLDDNQLETAVNSFSQQQKPSTGWGWSTVLDDLMTREPKRVPVRDMAAFQENLINLGYASPLTIASGTWDPSWYGAARRFDRDMRDGQMAGKTMLAAPLRQGVELLGQTMPSNIYRNIVGWAKGFYEQTPETVERVGLLGGAVSGAAIGGIAAGPVGAIAGGVIGGAIGFFGDLLTDQPDEANQSFLASFVDALTPFEEYASNPKAFFEDLGYVGTVASVIGGVSLGAGLVKGATSAEGIAASLGSQGAADVQLGLPGSIGRWVTGKIAPDSLEAVSNAIARVSPVAHLSKYPAAGMVNGVFTGLSAASVGIHITAGLGQGANQVNEDIRSQAASLVQSATQTGRKLTPEEMDLIDRANKGVGVGTIERAIAGVAVPGKLGSLNMGPQIFGMPLSDWLLPDNLLDVASFFLWPQKLFPIVPGAIQSAVGKAMDAPLGSLASSWSKLSGSEHMLRPWVQYLTGDGISVADARAFAKEHITPAMDAHIRLDAGVKSRVASILHDKGLEGPNLDISYSQERFDLIAKMRLEGEAGRSPTAMRLYGETVERDNLLLAHLLDTKPGGIDRRTSFLNYKQALDDASNLEAAYRNAGGLTDVFMAGERGTTRARVAQIPEGTLTIPYGRVTIQHDAVELERQASKLEADAARARDATFADGSSPKSILDFTSKADELEAEAARLRALIDKGGTETAARTAEQYRLVPQRLDTPTRAEWFEMKRQVRSYRQKLDALQRQAKKAEAGIETGGMGSPQYMHLHQELSDLVDGWLGRGLISEAMRDAALGQKTSRRLLGILDSHARSAAIDADVPDAVRTRFQALGYKPVLTGENMILPTEAEKWVEVSGIGDYTRRRSFFEMIGVREKVDLDNDLWKVRQASEMSELQQVADTLGIERTAKDIYRKIYESMEATNHAGTAWGPFVFTGRGPKLFKIDIRQLRPRDIIDALEGVLPQGKEWDGAMAVYGALRRGTAYGGEWVGLSPIATARALGRSLSLSGLPGFSDLVRTWHLEGALRWEPKTRGIKGVSANKLSKAKYAAAGAAVGAGVGLASGDQPSDILASAAIGAGVGLGTRYFAGKSYGYLPDHLVQLNTALRYTLSLTFDAGRYSEQAMIGMAKYGLPSGAAFAPKRYALSGAPPGGWKSPYRDGTVSGDEAWGDIIQHWDDVNGTNWFKSLDDTDRRMYQAGLLGFQPRNVEAMQAWLLYQRGWSRAKIEEAIKTVGRYGVGRSAAEKSANFVFFPFSFSKKLLSTLGDWAIQRPGRNLLVYEGMRRYYESTLDEDFHHLVEDHLPLLEQLSRVNNLTYGLSPGRFFLKGLGDQRTNFGKASFILSQFFAPSGAATPLAQAAGSAADLAVNMFVPVVFTGESIDRLGGVDGVNDILSRYIPLTREITQYFNAANDQATAALQGETPWAQVQDFLDQKREFTDGLRPMAALMGYATPEAFLSSNAGAPWKAQYDQLNLELQRRYPSAQGTLGGFESRTQQSAQVLYEIAHKEERGDGEDAILALAKTIETYERMKGLGFLSPSIADRVESTAVRTIALKHVEDRRFRELYALLFMRDFGPIEAVA